MRFKAGVLLAAVAALVVVPLLLRPSSATAPADARQVIVITPHNEQIRSEYGPAFDAWHREHYGEPAEVVFAVPGGTSEIRKMLKAQYEAALKRGETPGGDADLVFGGGSYEHDVLKQGVRVTVDGDERFTSISTPVDFDDAWLAETFGENEIGDARLYDADRFWVGTALSGFGIVYNRDALADLGIPEPDAWDDLCDPRLRGWVALVNPGQSGSVTTAFEAILQRRGWHGGWQVLRRAGANSRYFSGSSLKPPIDVSRGDAAMGVCIDFFGRYQAQSVMVAGGGARVGYVVPAGENMIDPDPISMLTGAPNPEMARRFIEFCLSVPGQALWQFPAGASPDGLGPAAFELRRMPIRRSMYVDHFDRMVDRVNPYEIARPFDDYDRVFRSFIALLFSATVMDNHHQLRDAWSAIVSHPAYPATTGLVTAADVTDPQLAAMLELFDALPEVPGPEGRMLSLDRRSDLAEIKSGWLRGGWSDLGLWDAEERPAEALRRRLVESIRANYRKIVELAKPQEA